MCHSKKTTVHKIATLLTAMILLTGLPSFGQTVKVSPDTFTVATDSSLKIRVYRLCYWVNRQRGCDSIAFFLQDKRAGRQQTIKIKEYVIGDAPDTLVIKLVNLDTKTEGVLLESKHSADNYSHGGQYNAESHIQFSRSLIYNLKTKKSIFDFYSDYSSFFMESNNPSDSDTTDAEPTTTAESQNCSYKISYDKGQIKIAVIKKSGDCRQTAFTTGTYIFADGQFKKK